jgi:hypothetical protein
LSASSPVRDRPRSAFTGSRAVFIPWIALTALTIWGADYYFSDLGIRLRHDQHSLLRPSGLVGQSAGIASFAGFLFLWLYPMRKRLGAAGAWMGAIGRWLDVHIVVGLTIPLLGAVHAAWRFDGIIGLGYWAMFIVALSGVVGRYVYVHIPRGRSGLELGAEEVAQQRRELLVELASVTGLETAVVESVLAAEPIPASRAGIIPSLVQMVRDDLARRRGVGRLQARWEELGPDRPELDRKKLQHVAALARRQMALAQQARLLAASQRIFRHWHTLHKPVAITALLAVTIHVVVVVAVGSTWLY